MAVATQYCLLVQLNGTLFFSTFSWYHANLKRDEAEDMLKRVRKNGAFLVRRKEADQPPAEHSEAGTQRDESYAISFRLKFIPIFHLLLFCISLSK